MPASGRILRAKGISRDRDGQFTLRRLLPWLVFALCLALSLVVRIQVPEIVLAAAGHDDQLQVRRAASLGSGDWLGPFDNLILSKGPGYSLFIWLTSDLGLPIKVAEGLVQVSAALLVALAVARLRGGAVLAVVAGAVVAFDPAYLGQEAARLNRTSFYASVCLAVVASTVLAVAPVHRPGGRVRLVASFLYRAAMGAVAGTFAAAYWITREERPWLVPTLALLCIGLLLLGLRSNPGVPRWRVFAPPLAALLVAGCTAVVGVGEVVQRNDARYGYAGVTDFVDGEFPELYGALSAIDVGSPRRFVPVSVTQREAAYEASPTFATLRHGLEVANRHWVAIGCSSTGVCDDYAGGWFVWALRDAIAAVLPAADSPSQQDFMRRAASEISAGCGAAYDCRVDTLSFLPDLRPVTASHLLAASGRGVVAVVRFRTGQVPELPADQQTWTQIADTVVGIEPTAEAQPSTPPAAVARWRAGLSAVLGVLLGVLALPALAGMVLALRTGAGGSRAVALLAAGAAIGVAARLGLLVLVETTSFEGIANGYLMPAFDLALLATVLGTWCLVVVIMARRRVSGTAHAAGSRHAAAPSPPASHRGVEALGWRTAAGGG